MTNDYRRGAAPITERSLALVKFFRILSFAVLALMVAAALYAGIMGIVHWACIGV